jgi:thiol-disulfide isomerase/thioredoxin
MVLKVSDNMVGQTATAIGDMTNGTPSLVMIICNHCPYVLFRMQAISQLVKDYNDRVYCIAVNSNDSSKYEEDAPELMPEFKNKYGLACDYIFDEDQSIAKSYGAVCTPEFYVVDGEGIIVYHGELDPSHTSNDLIPTGSSLRHALDLTLAGKSIDWEPNPSFGCSVKWKQG